MYCKKCKITYKDDNILYEDEYLPECPMCMLKHLNKTLKKKLKETEYRLNHRSEEHTSELQSH